MENSTGAMSKQFKIRYVNHLPDLITKDNYEDAHTKKLVKIQIQVTDNEVVLLTDSPYPIELENLLSMLGPDVIEMMLCG